MVSRESFILHIDTSTDICSVALSANESLIATCADESKARRHAALLPLMIDDVLRQFAITLNQISAIAYSQGPGSYTGLRVGLSSAKAICMAMDIPLIAVSTLLALAHSVDNVSDIDYIVPMIDAGRDEVYHAIYDPQFNMVDKASPLILNEHSFSTYTGNEGRLRLVGDGSIKAKTLLKPLVTVTYGSEKMLAEYMIVPATHKFLTSDFENLAYSVPLYLKSPAYIKSGIKS